MVEKDLPTTKRADKSATLAAALCKIDSTACDQIFKRATEVALELISKPGGMDAADRLRFNSLISAGLSPNSKDGQGKTLLMSACYVGDMETIDALRSTKGGEFRGVRRDIVDEFGRDAEDWARMSGRENVIELRVNWRIEEEGSASSADAKTTELASLSRK